MKFSKKSNIFSLFILFAITLIFYKFNFLKPEILSIIFTPFFTLLILLILEESKAKWNTKYEAFKFLYATRGNIVNYEVVKHLNCIDVIFISDKKVRQKWKDLLDCLNYYRDLATKNKTIMDQFNKERDLKLYELLNAMAESLGLNQDITITDIANSYYPEGLTKIDNLAEETAFAKFNYYTSGTKFFGNQEQNTNQQINLINQ